MTQTRTTFLSNVMKILSSFVIMNLFLKEPEWYHLNSHKNELPEHIKQSLYSEREHVITAGMDGSYHYQP